MGNPYFLTPDFFINIRKYFYLPNLSYNCTLCEHNAIVLKQFCNTIDFNQELAEQLSKIVVKTSIL